jgi:cell division protease FtsH
MYADLASVMGGRVAEELIFGYDKVSSGASSDIQQATKLARAMVLKWGMSDKLGPLLYEESHENFLGYSQSQSMSMSNETAKLVDSEIRALVDGGYNEATRLLKKYKKQLATLAEGLLEFETLSGDEIAALLTSGTRPDRSEGDKGQPKPLTAGGSSIPKTRKPKEIGGPASAGA